MNRILSPTEVIAFLDMMNAKTSTRECWRQISKKELELDLMKFNCSLAQLELTGIEGLLDWPEGFYEPELVSILHHQQATLRCRLESCNVAAQEKLQQSIQALYKKLKRLGSRAERLSRKCDEVMEEGDHLNAELDRLLAEEVGLDQEIDCLLDEDNWEGD
ncbi:MAG: hypothetical protein EOP49_17710 [Sphingobacteriales bacterium]|nr:MAG: hypothetical protein EOP49_17710 [Sphingobacteriales bacterium]